MTQKLILLLLLLSTTNAWCETLQGKVVGVADGDTITLLDDENRQFKVRLAGIDAPEKKQDFGNVSKKSLSDLVFGQRVTVEWSKEDRYGRVVGKVLKDSRDINLLQIENGLAWYYRKYQNELLLGDRLDYLHAEEAAMHTRKGLWSHKSPIAPWDSESSFIMRIDPLKDELIDQVASSQPINQLEEARNQIFRKVGRNLYLFQQIEKILKFLNANSSMAGYIGEIESKQKQKVEEISKLNMGPLVGQFFDNVYSKSDKPSSSPDSLKEPYFSFDFNINVNPEFIGLRKEVMKNLVEDRNYLVHHLFLDFDMQSVDRFDEVEEYLDKQREKAVNEYEQLRVIAKTYSEAVGVYKNFIDSEEGLEYLELIHLQNSQLVSKLLEIHSKSARGDGWTLLNHAGNELKKAIPDVMADLKQLYGHKTLKEILVASQMFHLVEEPTQNGYRQLYKPKAD